MYLRILKVDFEMKMKVRENNCSGYTCLRLRRDWDTSKNIIKCLCHDKYKIKEWLLNYENWKWLKGPAFYHLTNIAILNILRFYEELFPMYFWQNSVFHMYVWKHFLNRLCVNNIPTPSISIGIIWLH